MKNKLDGDIIKEWDTIYQSIHQRSDEEKGLGVNHASLALEYFLGEEWIKKTMDYSMECKGPGLDLAMSTLRFIHSEIGTDYAYEIYINSEDEDEKRAALFAIKDIAHPKALNWVEDLIVNSQFVGLGLGILDQLLWCESVYPNEETERLLDLVLELHPNKLNEQVEFIRSYLKHRLRD